MPSNVVTYTRPLLMANPPKCVNDGIVFALENNSLPVWRSTAYKIALPTAASARSLEEKRLPLSLACRTNSALERATTTPFAIRGGSGTFMSRDIQAGVNTGWPSFSSTLNAMMLPFGAGPFTAGNAGAFGCTGPQAGAYTQRTPLSSSQLANAPQNPRPAKSTSSLV